MTKQKVLLYIPLVIIAGLLLYSWTVILLTEALATWRHYIALELFLILVLLCLRNFKLTIIGTALYLLLGTLNVLCMTVEVTTTWFKIGPVETPPLQFLSLGLLTLFFALNFDTLTNMYLDHKESKDWKS